MGCEHNGPAEVIEMAEQWLDRAGVPRDRWPGKRFGFGENVDTMWRSVYTEIERRGDEWVVTKIDRSPEPIPPAREGLQEVSSGESGRSR